jgi:hypothetical protein
MIFAIDLPTLRSAVPAEMLDDAAVIASVAFENNALNTPPLCVLPLDFIWFFLDLYAPLFVERLAERFTARLVALRRFAIVSMYILYRYNNEMESKTG